jgi:integrase
MKRLELTSEWIENWRPTRSTEVTDRGCKGLLLRGGPSGGKAFYRWASERREDGSEQRKRVRLGTWPAMSLGAAREALNAAREGKRGKTSGAGGTVADLAQAYRRDILGRREPSSAEWSWTTIRTHLLPARPDPKRPPFGDWIAATVRAPDIAAVVRLAREERTVEAVDAKGRKTTLRVGGPGAARVALREAKAIFAAAVGAGSLEWSPAAVLQARALGLRGTKRARYLDAEELSALFTALDLNELLDGTEKPKRLTPAVRLAIALLHYAPARSHSLIAAKWEEVDLDAARWTIPAEKMKLHKEERAEARPFTMPLCKTAVAILRRLQGLAGESTWVLPGKNPKAHIDSKVLIRALGRLQESGRLKFSSRLTIHDARRTWRAWAGELGVTFEVAEKSLAHTLPGVADVYARAEMVEQRAAAAELVGAAFDRIRLGEGAKVVPIQERVG